MMLLGYVLLMSLTLILTVTMYEFPPEDPLEGTVLGIATGLIVLAWLSWLGAVGVL